MIEVCAMHKIDVNIRNEFVAHIGNHLISCLRERRQTFMDNNLKVTRLKLLRFSLALSMMPMHVATMRNEFYFIKDSFE